MEIHDDELYHWGIFGMKWGVRRYQNPDGTLTPEGRKRYRKSAKEMTDEELVSAINRLVNEKRYTELVKSMEPEHRNRTQQFFANVRRVAKTAEPVLAPFGKAYTYGMEKALTNAVDKYFTSEDDKQIRKLEKEQRKLDAMTKVREKEETLARAEAMKRENGTSAFYDYLLKNGGNVTVKDALNALAKDQDMTVDELKAKLGMK